MKSKLKRAQDFALDQWLSEYPEDQTYDWVIECLKKDTWNEKDVVWEELITPWELVEDLTGEAIADLIESTCKDAQRLLG